ncbi:hypothetical protein Wenmar_01513 [Wenxinia marina DSM 24838]|uniref:Terminase large subunit gp17-like C-terminal domain-containing protein n=2 Tax=Wenxinia TaxID=653686 RepID=A0A0D0QFY0_9RHOB|nr:hypothetical protein Wenmar_01513 [Wenxinia marina DSM 24838]
MVEGPTPRAPGRARRVALVGETYDQTREVMVMGDSGLLACSPPDRRPDWIATRRLLVWPNGAVASLHSASEPESLRGPQFDAAWVDELAKWKKAKDTWEMLALAVRLGADPRICATTTPRSVPFLKALMARDSTVTTRAPTEANRANLADSYLAEVRAMFGDTRVARQELDGEYLDSVDGALWPWPLIERQRCAGVPQLTRVVVAVDPPASGHAGSDACGIVVAGAVTDGPALGWRAFVLEDATVEAASPQAWAEAAVAAYHRHGAARLVAEVNQGGAMVEAVVRGVDPLVSYRAVHAQRSKAMRAETVSALYERGQVFHAGGFPRLEEQMSLMTAQGFQGGGSPDRLDALVWALHELLLRPAGDPRMRAI